MRGFVSIFQIAGLVAFAAAGLLAQTARGGFGGVLVASPQQGAQNGGTYQQGYVAGQQAAELQAATAPRAAAGGRGGSIGQVITGSPVTAREETKSVQTLGDGTLIENTTSSVFIRDSQGRTRTEQTNNGRTSIVITDPVAGLRITVDPEAKSAVRMQGYFGLTTASSTLAQNLYEVATTLRDPRAATIAGGGTYATTTATLSAQPVNPSRTEDLGQHMENGVMAQGSRITMTIPKGRIGNNRDINVVNERWYSKDLQMLVKTVNSDPRYGTTTYELTNINQAAPDPTLFQIPVGYAVREGGARGGGGGFGGRGAGSVTSSGTGGR